MFFVSVIMPCRNEEKYIERCLKSVIKQDYPKEKLEVLVIDGMSEDKTREIIKKHFSQYSFIKVLDNPQKFTPFGLNIGIKEAKGEVIIRMDAHATYEKDYISECLKYLKKHEADNVGGVIKTLPGKDTLIAKAITLCLSCLFGAGNSYFRIGSKEPRLVDTVFGGCYKKEIFKKIGLFNENLIRSQDIEFNLRLRKSGGKIFLIPDIKSCYYSQSTLRGFLKHGFVNGIWVTYPLKFRVRIFSWRHLIPLIFVLSLIGSGILATFSLIFLRLFLFIIISYLLANIYFSVKIAKREKNFKYLFIMPVVFASRHVTYGLGSFWGLIKVLF